MIDFPKDAHLTPIPVSKDLSSFSAILIIAKHKKDVFRLAAMLGTAETFAVPKQLSNDIKRFCKEVSSDLPNANFIKAAGLGRTTGERLIQQLKNCFILS